MNKIGYAYVLVNNDLEKPILQISVCALLVVSNFVTPTVLLICDIFVNCNWVATQWQ